MPAGVNRWHGVGNMTGDPELKQGSQQVSDRCMFSMAINRPGQEQEPTFLDVICWDKLAQQVSEFGRKGRLVYVEGEIEVRRWEDNEGNRRKAFRIKAYTVRFLDPRPADADSERAQPKETAAEYDDLPF